MRPFAHALLAVAALALCSSARGADAPSSQHGTPHVLNPEQCKKARENFKTKTFSLRGAVAQREWIVNCYQTIVDHREATGYKGDSNDDNDNLRGLLATSRMELTWAKNERDFKDTSMFLGATVLSEPLPDGSNDPLAVLGVQALIEKISGDNTGFGFFGVVNAEAFNNGVDYVGVGALFSARLQNTAYPVNFGIGYMIDRDGYTTEEQDSTGMLIERQGDRSGPFILLSFNPVTVPAKAWENLDLFK